MASILIIKENLKNPMEWYSAQMKQNAPWELDENCQAYHQGSVYMKQKDGIVFFEDLSENEFFGWETASWIAMAQGKELIYGYYDEDNGNAEFVHIQNGMCVRDFRMFDFETDTDEGNPPSFEYLDDVAEFVDTLSP